MQAEKSESGGQTPSTLSDMAMSTESVSPSSSSTSQLTEKHYFVSGSERSATDSAPFQQTQFKFSVSSSPPSQQTASIGTTASTDEPFQVRSPSVSCPTEPGDRKIETSGRRTDVERTQRRLFQDLDKKEDAVEQPFPFGSLTDRMSAGKTAEPGMLSSLLLCFSVYRQTGID